MQIVRKKLLSARISPFAPNFRRVPYSGQRAFGIKYEKRVQQYFQDMYGGMYLASPWIQYRLEGERVVRWCQPDALYFEPYKGYIHCLEIKTSHTVKAWEQIRKLYEPVLNFIFPRHLWELLPCEVVRYYDPLIKLPEEVQLVDGIERYSSRFRVHILKP